VVIKFNPEVKMKALKMMMLLLSFTLFSVVGAQGFVGRDTSPKTETLNVIIKVGNQFFSLNRGVGAVKQRPGWNEGQAILMGREGAFMDAYKGIAQSIKGIDFEVSGESADKAMNYEKSSKSSKALLKGAYVVSERLIGSDFYEVIMAYPLPEGFPGGQQERSFVQNSVPAYEVSALEASALEAFGNSNVQVPGRGSDASRVVDISPLPGLYGSSPVRGVMVSHHSAGVPVSGFGYTEEAEIDECPEYLCGKSTVASDQPIVISNLDLQMKIEELERINRLKDVSIKSLEARQKR
jgi:hypothetical protein